MRCACFALLLACLTLVGCEKKVEMPEGTMSAVKPGDVTISGPGGATPSAPAK